MYRKSINFEKILITKLRQGDSGAFSDIFSAYYRDLAMFAFSFTREWSTAEEIVQETFMKLWEDHEKLNVRTSLKSLLLKSVQNRFIDLHRHKKIVDIHSSYVINNSPLFEWETDNYVLISELEKNIEQAIDALPIKLRETYIMNRIEGLKYQEIATKLNVSVRTIEVRISKALELLRIDLRDFL